MTIALAAQRAITNRSHWRFFHCVESARDFFGASRSSGFFFRSTISSFLVWGSGRAVASGHACADAMAFGITAPAVRSFNCGATGSELCLADYLPFWISGEIVGLQKISQKPETTQYGPSFRSAQRSFSRTLVYIRLPWTVARWRQTLYEKPRRSRSCGIRNFRSPCHFLRRFAGLW